MFFRCTLDTWTGFVIGALRLHGINLDNAHSLPSEEPGVRGKTVTCGTYTLVLGDRRSADEDGREAFFEIRSVGNNTPLLSITHRMFVQRDGQVIPRVWVVDVAEELRATLGITPGETEDQVPTLNLIDHVVGQLLAA